MNIEKTGQKFGRIMAKKIKFKGFIEIVDDIIFPKVFGAVFQLLPEKYHKDVNKMVDILDQNDAAHLDEKDTKKIFDSINDGVIRMTSNNGGPNSGQMPPDPRG